MNRANLCLQATCVYLALLHMVDFSTYHQNVKPCWIHDVASIAQLENVSNTGRHTSQMPPLNTSMPSWNVTEILPTTAFRHRPSAVVLVFGLAQRSRGCTERSRIEHIVKPLQKAGYQVHMHICDNVPERDTIVDGKPYKYGPCALIYSDSCHSFDMRSIDKKISQLCSNTTCTYTSEAYTPTMVQNAMRQLYAEYHAGLWMRENAPNASLAVAISSGMQIANTVLPACHVWRVRERERAMY